MNSLFSYKSGSSFLHKCPTWCKILFIPVISVLTLCLPPWFCIALVVIQFVLACILRFSLSEQYCDVRPVIFYAFLLYFVKLLSIAVEFFVNAPLLQNSEILDGISKNLPSDFGSRGFDSFCDFWAWFCNHFTWDSEKETLFMLTKILCLMQTASLLFKTSTSLQIREGFEIIELAVRQIFVRIFRKNCRKNGEKLLRGVATCNSDDSQLKNAPIATALSMFVNFIPMVSAIWAQSKRAWFARGGKKGARMYAVLLPVLFSVGMKKAWNTARAIQIRS